MIGCYIRMFSEIKQHMQRLDENTALDRSQIYSQQRRVTITLFIVLSCFVLCWIPYCVYANYVTFEEDKSKIPGYANAIAYCFGYMNSACNPIIYAWRSPSFREGYKEILCQEPSYVVSDDTLHDSSPGPLRRLSTMIHSSFRGSRANSRRNSDESIHSLRLGRNSVTSPAVSSHKLIRQLTSKTAKGSSLIRRDGSIIMIKNGKIISMRRDPSFCKISDDVFLPSPSDSACHSIGRSHSNSSTLNRVKEESFESEPLLKGDNSSHTHMLTVENGHIGLTDVKSPDKNHNLPNHSDISDDNRRQSPRKRLTRHARLSSTSDDNIAVHISDSSTLELGNDSSNLNPDESFSIHSSSSHGQGLRITRDSDLAQHPMIKSSSESNMKTHSLTVANIMHLHSKSSNIIYHVPYLESSLSNATNLNNQASYSDSNMKQMPQHRQRWTVTKDNIRNSPK